MEGKSTPALLTPAATSVHRTDGTLRMLIWGALLYVAIRQLSQGGTVSPATYIIPLILLVGLITAILFGSIAPVAQQLRVFRHTQPLLMSALPLLLLVPYVLVARQEPDFDPSTMLITGMALFLPISCAILNVPEFRRSDVLLGLVTVLVPLLVPIAQTRQLTHIGVRLAAFILPVALLLLSSTAQKKRLNFLLICGLLSLWYSVQFGAWPTYDLLPFSAVDAGNGSPLEMQPIYYFNLAAGALLIYALGLSGWFNRTGLSFRPSAKGAVQIGLNFGLLAVLVGALGLAAGLIVPGEALSRFLTAVTTQPGELIGQMLFTFAVIALPQELLFRGTFLPYFQETFQWPDALAILASAILFGAAHWQPDGGLGLDVVRYAGLAAICGIFFARVYLAAHDTAPGNAASSTVLHTLVRLIGGFAFRA